MSNYSRMALLVVASLVLLGISGCAERTATPSKIQSIKEDVERIPSASLSEGLQLAEDAGWPARSVGDLRGSVRRADINMEVISFISAQADGEDATMDQIKLGGRGLDPAVLGVSDLWVLARDAGLGIGSRLAALHPLLMNWAGNIMVGALGFLFVIVVYRKLWIGRVW